MGNHGTSSEGNRQAFACRTAECHKRETEVETAVRVAAEQAVLLEGNRKSVGGGARHADRRLQIGKRKWTELPVGLEHGDCLVQYPYAAYTVHQTGMLSQKVRQRP